MTPVPDSFVDPYADDSHIKPPPRREGNPDGPSQPFQMEFVHPPVIQLFPSTGSFYCRMGLITDATMSSKEQRFEKYVNEMQEGHDTRSQWREWERGREYEQDVIYRYYQIGGDVRQFNTQMITEDQEAMESQCQRRRQKAVDIQSQMSLDHKFWSDRRHDESAALEAAQRKMDDERRGVKAIKAALDRKAAAQARGRPLANTSQATSSVDVGSSSSQKQKSHEDIRRQFKQQVQDSRRLSSATNGQSGSSAEANSSTLQEQERIRRQFREQVQSSLPSSASSASSATTTDQPISAEAGSSALSQEQEAMLSAAEDCKLGLQMTKEYAVFIRMQQQHESKEIRNKLLLEQDATMGAARIRLQQRQQTNLHAAELRTLQQQELTQIRKLLREHRMSLSAAAIRELEEEDRKVDAAIIRGEMRGRFSHVFEVGDPAHAVQMTEWVVGRMRLPPQAEVPRAHRR